MWRRYRAGISRGQRRSGAPPLGRETSRIGCLSSRAHASATISATISPPPRLHLGWHLGSKQARRRSTRRARSCCGRRRFPARRSRTSAGSCSARSSDRLLRNPGCTGRDRVGLGSDADGGFPGTRWTGPLRPSLDQFACRVRPGVFGFQFVVRATLPAQSQVDIQHPHP